MPQEIVFENLPAGYAENAARSGEKVKVRLTDFVSTEDGDELVTKLEGLQQILFMLRLPSPVLPSMVHSLLAIIRKDKTGTVYLNEVQTIGQMPVKGGCKNGEDRIVLYARRRGERCSCYATTRSTSTGAPRGAWPGEL